MSVYSETTSNTPDIELEVPTSCYNCSNDCMGILLEIFKEVGDVNE